MDKVHSFASGKSLMYQQGNAELLKLQFSKMDFSNQENASKDEGCVDRGLKQGRAFEEIPWASGWRVMTF